ncbi:MAG: Mg chelatase, subunit ChlI [Myxococcales bacterium]|nr:Mg chelatase, subunit ChlI [Myxococcales bacterium]
MTKVRIVEDVRSSELPVTAIYVRVTAEESVKTDLSLPNQRSRAIELCDARGWPVAKLYQEPKHVGGDLGPEKRPALAELLHDVEEGRVVRVIVRHTDRLWRSTDIQSAILRVFHAHSIELWDHGGQREFKTAGGRFALNVLGAASQLEKEMVGERVREMKRGKAKAGKVGGGPAAFGFTSQLREKRELVARGLSEDDAYRAACEKYPLAKTWYVDDAESKTVVIIFDLYLEKRMGARRISEELNRQGLRRRSGRKWCPVKVGKVINSPAVAGFTSYDEQAYQASLPSKSAPFRQTLFAGTHPAIIPAERWHEAQRLKTEVNAKRVRTKGSPTSRTYPLSGVLRCAQCGSPMTGKSSGHRENAYYVCNRRRYYGPRDGCDGPTILQNWAESTTFKYLDEFLRSPSVMAEILERARRRVRKDSPDLRASVERVRAELVDVEGRQRKWLEKFEQAKDDASAEIVWGRLRELKAKQTSLAEDLAALERSLATISNEPISEKTIARHLASLASGGTSAIKRRTLVESLERRHALRVTLIDPRRLALSLRLDGFAERGDKPIGDRLVVIGTGSGGHKRLKSSSARPVSPDLGKTMLARRIPTVLPPMTRDEALETTKIYSALGLADRLIEERPFRAPHHTISSAALLGGGSNPRPGEISLAHNGVLFLDEVPELSRLAIEAMRQPLEERNVTINRVNGTLRLPASFLLVAAANPCPCGWLGSGVRECTCSQGAIERYQSRLSGPLLDRIDLQVYVQPVPLADLRRYEPAEASSVMRARVVAARERQRKRLAMWGLGCNAEMTTSILRATCKLDDIGERTLAELVARRPSISARGVDRMLKVARTIADLLGQADIDAECLTEASAYNAGHSADELHVPLDRIAN